MKRFEEIIDYVFILLLIITVIAAILGLMDSLLKGRL